MKGDENTCLKHYLVSYFLFLLQPLSARLFRRTTIRAILELVAIRDRMELMYSHITRLQLTLTDMIITPHEETLTLGQVVKVIEAGVIKKCKRSVS